MVAKHVIQDLKEQTDCRTLIERDLGAPHGGGETKKAWSWRCPMHHESKGYSLTAWADGWKCWGACQTGGDAIAWLRTYHGLGFEEATKALGAVEEREITGHGNRLHIHVHQHDLPAIAQPPTAEWQAVALQIVETAQRTLWSEAGSKALAYLRHRRGLWDQVIADACLGFHPGHFTEYTHHPLPGGGHLHMPCGITIPWLVDGQLWGIKVRRAAGDIKYQQPAGGQIAGPCLYWADQLLPGWPVLFLEGEFDCLVAWQEAPDLVCPVTLGAASNRLNPRWYPQLAQCSPLLVAYDMDDAGDQGAKRLAALTDRARRIAVPTGKDLSDYYRASGIRAVYTWLESVLAEQAERNEVHA